MIDGYHPLDRDVMWTALAWPGSELLDLHADAGGIVADGVVLAAPEGEPLRLAYRIECDPGWRVRSLTVNLHHHPRRTLTRDGHDRWFDNGAERPDLAGCAEIDISLTPFTNTLPIRRLGLGVGEAADLRVVYVQLTEGTDFSAVGQRYTRLADGYRYASGDFTADLAVDGDGLVTGYPGLWRMEGC